MIFKGVFRASEKFMVQLIQSLDETIAYIFILSRMELTTVSSFTKLLSVNCLANSLKYIL